MTLFILFCRTEMAVEELFQWGELFKFPVRPLQDGFIGIIQPVTLTFGYGIQSLRIELVPMKEAYRRISRMVLP